MSDEVLQIAARTRKRAEFQAMYRKPLANIALTALEPLPVALVFVLVTASVPSRRRRPTGNAPA